MLELFVSMLELLKNRKNKQIMDLRKVKKSKPHFFLHIQNFGFYKIYQKEVTLFNTAQAKTQNLYDIDKKEKGNVNCALWD